jgi:hypothetical protein
MAFHCVPLVEFQGLGLLLWDTAPFSFPQSQETLAKIWSQPHPNGLWKELGGTSRVWG